jgi:hypothetical protein
VDLVLSSSRPFGEADFDCLEVFDCLASLHLVEQVDLRVYVVLYITANL